MISISPWAGQCYNFLSSPYCQRDTFSVVFLPINSQFPSRGNETVGNRGISVSLKITGNCSCVIKSEGPLTEFQMIIFNLMQAY